VIAAVMASLAVWCLVPVSAGTRSHALFVTPRDPLRLDPRIVAAAFVPVAAVVMLGVPVGLLVGVGAAPMTYQAVGRLESASVRRRSARIAAQLPSALDLMVAALEVGKPPATAFALASEATADPLGVELALVASRLAVAAYPAAVWRTVVDDPALAPLGRAFRRAERSGMPVAQVVAGVADELRRERRARRREQSRKVGVRTAAPLGACFLPAFFLIGIVPTVIATFRTFSF
jgi:Flp pilus assembly protein TadB